MSEIFPLHLFRFNHPDKPTIKLLTYNIHYLGDSFDERQVGIANEILKEDPDIAFLCEFNLHYSTVLDSIITKNRQYHRYHKRGTSCVFYSKYPIDSIVGIYPSGSNNKHSLNNKVHVAIGLDTVTIVGCHLNSSRYGIMTGYEKRKIESDSIYENIREERHPIIVMGDFNDISGSYALHRIKEVGLEDAWWKGGFGYGATFHEKWLRLRLDHILFQSSKLNLHGVKVVDSNYSDHNAISAEFSIK